MPKTWPITNPKRAPERRYYARNRDAILAKQRAHWAANKTLWRNRRLKLYYDTRDRIDSIKMERGCIVCGYAKHPAALDFDHREGTIKLFQIAQCTGKPWATIEAEMAKCDVVCANCHRIRTIHRRKKAQQTSPLILTGDVEMIEPNGVRFFLEQTDDGDDSSAVTFWGKRDLREVLRLALEQLDKHYGTPR